METPISSERAPRKWKRLILVPALLGLVGGFLVSYAFPPKYTSTATVLVEGQKIPANYIQPVITADFTQRVATLQQQVLSTTLLRRQIESLDLVKPEKVGRLIAQISATMEVTPVITSMSAAVSDAGTLTGEKRPPSVTDEPVPGFNVSYSDEYPDRARKVCNMLTSMILDQNLKSRADIARGTTVFLDREVEDARRALETLGTQLAQLDKKGVPPGAEREVLHKTLAIEYENAQAVYRDLLAKQSMAKLGEDMEAQQMGEQMAILAPANLPDDPSFPVRPMFAFGGFCTGLVFGIALALWRRFRRQSPADGISDEPVSSDPPRRSFFSGDAAVE